MLEIELIKLVESIRKQKCESNYIELKSAEKGCPRLFDTFSSFSNQQNGGKIVFGIDENADYGICGVYNASDLQKRIMEQGLQMEPAIRPLCTVATIDGKEVVCAEIQEIDIFSKPCFYKGAGRLKGSYVRVGDSDRIMSEYEVYSFEAFKKKFQDEFRETERAEVSDISTPAFDKYLAMLKTQKPNFEAMTDVKIQKLQGFTINGNPTLAGIILFAEYPQAYYPQLCITAVSIPGTEMSMTGSVGERFLDNQKIDGTLSQMLKDALFFVRKNMKKKTIIDKNTGKRTDKTEYPIEAVREIIVNALIHRDYSIYTDSAPITIRMFTDRIEVENPGGLYGRMTLDKLGKVSADTRNPFIANALEIMGETENRYSGIPTVINAMKEAELPPPKFENDMGIFRATLYNKVTTEAILDDIESEIIDFCKTPKSRSEIEKLFEGRMTIAYIMAKYIHPMTEKGILTLAIPDKPKSKKQKYFVRK